MLQRTAPQPRRSPPAPGSGSTHSTPDRLEVTYRYCWSSSPRVEIQADRDKAIAVYDSVEIAEGKSIPLSSKKIQLYYSLQDTASSRAEADRLRSLVPRIDFQVFSGDIYSMFGLNDQAKRSSTTAPASSIPQAASPTSRALSSPPHPRRQRTFNR